MDLIGLIGNRMRVRQKHSVRTKFQTKSPSSSIPLKKNNNSGDGDSGVRPPEMYLRL